MYVKIKPKYAESVETKILFSGKWIFGLIWPPPNFKDSILLILYNLMISIHFLFLCPCFPPSLPLFCLPSFLPSLRPSLPSLVVHLSEAKLLPPSWSYCLMLETDSKQADKFTSASLQVITIARKEITGCFNSSDLRRESTIDLHGISSEFSPRS